MAKEKNITLDKLARMVALGFKEGATKTDLEKCATKEELTVVHTEMNDGFERLDLHISSLGSDWKERFDALEIRVRKLEQQRRGS